MADSAKLINDSIFSKEGKNALSPSEKLGYLGDVGQSLGVNYYEGSNVDWPAPPIPDPKNPQVQQEKPVISPRAGAKPSIFNRYSIFFYNNTTSNGLGGGTPEGYFDSIDRISKDLAQVRLNPTASNIIKWSQDGSTNAVEYAIEDFLWCKNYGAVPNNYLVTLRRFTNPIEDDLFDKDKVPVPDMGRLLTWVDGKENNWENVGLKWEHGFNWKPLKADLQVIDSSDSGWGKENSGLSVSGILSGTGQPLTNSKISGSDIGYNNNNATYGPIDVINETTVRDRGIKFTQTLKLTFIYKLKSIDGINPKIAFIDLLSNILIVTANKAPFWGGDVKYYGTAGKKIKPFGDPTLLQKGGKAGWTGYLNSILSGLSNSFNKAAGGAPLFSAEGIGNVFKSLGGNLLDQLAGMQLDKMGRPGIVAVDSLLSGENTGMWHVTVGNPANPIMSIGNLILKETSVEIHGALGLDDFPSEIKVVCDLEPAMPRDRIDIISMFHRNNRTYLTTPPETLKYAANVANIARKNGGIMTAGGKSNEGDLTNIKENLLKTSSKLNINNSNLNRFPNHIDIKTAPLKTAEQIG